MKKLFVLVWFVLFVSYANASEETPEWETNVFGFSWHENEKTQATGNTTNPGRGLRYNFSENFYVEGNYILRNTTNGWTGTLGAGFHTKILEVNNVPLKAGIQLLYMEYENKRHNTVMKGFLPMLTLRWGQEDDIAFIAGVFPKKGNSVVVVGLQIPIRN